MNNSQEDKRKSSKKAWLLFLLNHRKSQLAVGGVVALIGVLLIGLTAAPSGSSSSSLPSLTSSLPTSGTTSSPSSSITSSMSSSLTAFTVSFNSLGGSSVANQQVNQGGLVTPPTHPTRTGYTFGGWFRSNNDGDTLLTEWNFNTDSITMNTTLYAKWNINSYTLTFNSNGGSDVAAVTQNFQSPLGSLATPTRTGYTFAGWYRDANLTNTFSNTTMPAENLTLYAKWTVNQYTITFETNGGNAIAGLTRNFNAPIGTINTPTRIGHTFVGWFTDQAMTVAFTASTMPAENLTLYAKWTVTQYTLTFETNGGNAITSLTLDFQAPIGTLPTPTRTGYTFVGWFSNASLTQAFALTTMPSQNTTIYARWNINSYTLTFQTNGGTSVNPITRNFASNLGTLASPFRTGYTFGGWFTDQALTTAFTATTMPAENLTLYAKWTINQYTISYTPIIKEKMGFIVSGHEFSLGLTPDQRLFAWGSNAFGQLANGTGQNSQLPIFVDTSTYLNNGETIQSLYSGSSSFHAFMITSASRVFGWGRNHAGQLGDGTTTNRTTPVFITFNGLNQNETITELATGNNFTLALTSEGRVFAWGNGANGRLGTGNTTAQLTPTLISFPGLNQNETIVRVTTGGQHALSYTSENRLFTWGANIAGTLGVSTSTAGSSSTPMLISLPLNPNETIVDIEAGSEHSVVLTSDGRVFAFGSNGRRQIGDHTTVTSRQEPTLTVFSNITFLANEKITSITTGDFHTVGITSANRMISWGSNEFGQLGFGPVGNDWVTNPERPRLTTLNNLAQSETLITASAGRGHVIVLLSSGRVYSWGFNEFGQLGNGQGGASVNTGTPAVATLTNPLAQVIDYITIDFGATINLTNPTMQGFTFIGWFTDTNLNQPFTTTTMPGSNQQIYAGFEPI